MVQALPGRDNRLKKRRPASRSNLVLHPRMEFLSLPACHLPNITSGDRSTSKKDRGPKENGKVAKPDGHKIKKGTEGKEETQKGEGPGN